MFQKNRFLFVLLFAVQSLFAQIPQGFNYQATVRNQTGELLTNEYVGFKFHILQGSSDATPTYSELHYISTDDLGVVHLSIGSGNPEEGVFSQIDWSLGNYHMGIEINTGDGFIDMGKTQLMSVPFALYALNSGTTNSASLPQGTNDGDVLRWNSATNSWTVEDNAAPPACTPSPTLTTNEVSNLTDTSVTFSGRIEAPTCDPSVTSQGFVIGLNTLPKTTDEFIEVNGKAIAKEITGLQQNQTYYYRTYFTNPTGTYYGNEINFQTNVGAVLLNSSTVTNIKAFSADVSSYISNSGGGEITGRGVCWSTNPNPTIADSKTEDGSGLGSFTSNLVGLTEDTTYNIRSYATNEAGTTYGEKISFKTVEINVYLDANGITVKAKDGAEVGSKDTINGIVYTVVDSETLRQMKRDGVDVTNVCTSRITDMSNLFYNAQDFNQDISTWDVSNVTEMSRMFHLAYWFNQDLSAWDVSNVTYMDDMFNRSSFNQDIGNWDVSNVIDMTAMFYQATSFNQDLSTWDVSNVTAMTAMFDKSGFNQDIGNWDVSNVTDMSYMFKETLSFNQDIRTWDVSSVTNMSNMFYNATSFNQDLNTWDVSNVNYYFYFDSTTPQWTLPKPNFN